MNYDMDLRRRASQSSGPEAQKTVMLRLQVVMAFAQIVMAGLDPAIHPLRRMLLREE
jgi:hypothetical protein